jgi:hypothetical protein
LLDYKCGFLQECFALEGSPLVHRKLTVKGLDGRVADDNSKSNDEEKKLSKFI